MGEKAQTRSQGERLLRGSYKERHGAFECVEAAAAAAAKVKVKVKTEVEVRLPKGGRVKTRNSRLAELRISHR